VNDVPNSDVAHADDGGRSQRPSMHADWWLLADVTWIASWVVLIGVNR